MLEHDQNSAHIGSVNGSGETSLTRILHVHVFTVVTISVFFDTPASTVLELLRNLPPVPVFGNPASGGGSVASVHFEDIESRGGSEGDSGHTFPEAGPLDHAPILVNDFSLFKVEICVGLHRGGLHKWLQLVLRVSWCTLKTQNLLDRLELENGVAQTVGNVGELLLIGPLNVVLGALIVIVVGSAGLVLQGLLIVQLASLGEPGTGGLSPSVVVLEESVVELLVHGGVVQGHHLVEALGNVTHLLQVVGSNLRNVQINQESIVAVELPLLLLSQANSVDIVSLGDVLVGQDYARLSEFIARRIEVGQLGIFVFFVLINLEEEVLSSDHLVVSVGRDSFLVDLLSEFLLSQFFFNNLVDLILDSAQSWNFILIDGKRRELTTLHVHFLQLVKIGLLILSILLLGGKVLLGALPKRPDMVFFLAHRNGGCQLSRVAALGVVLQQHAA